MCLFIDHDNPVSTHVYEAIGYRPVSDTEEWVVTEHPSDRSGDHPRPPAP